MIFINYSIYTWLVVRRLVIIIIMMIIIIIRFYSVQNWCTDGPLPVANQLLIFIIKLASYIFSDYNIRYSYYSLSKFGSFGIFAQLRQGHEIKKLHAVAGSKLLKNDSLLLDGC